MGHAPRKEGVRGGGLVVHMGVESIAGEMGESLDILQRDFSGGRLEGLAQIQLGETAGEGGVAVGDLFRPRYPLFADGGEDVGAALNGGALHVMHHAANAAQFFAAPCAARPAMHHMRQRRAVARGLAHRRAVVEIEPSVEGCRTHR